MIIINLPPIGINNNADPLPTYIHTYYSPPVSLYHIQMADARNLPSHRAHELPLHACYAHIYIPLHLKPRHGAAPSRRKGGSGDHTGFVFVDPRSRFPPLGLKRSRVTPDLYIYILFYHHHHQQRSSRLSTRYGSRRTRSRTRTPLGQVSSSTSSTTSRGSSGH